MKDNLTTNVSDEAESPAFLVGAVNSCPYFAAKNTIMNELIRIAKLPPTNTFNGTLIRIGNINKMVDILIELRKIKKGINPTPSFATGGFVNGVNADKIFLDGNEYIIPINPEDPQ